MSHPTGQTGQMGVASGPPYLPTTWGLGGTPKKSVDVPVTAVFLALFIGGAVTHMTMLQKNKKRGHKFLMSGVMFGFNMARITTCVMRIASICLPRNINLAIAAQVFAAAGVLLIYILNLILTQRIIRAQHPQVGWSTPFSIFFKALYAIIICTLIMTITAVVQSFFTLDPHIRHIDRSLQLYGTTLFTVVSFLPIPLLLLSHFIPSKAAPEKFGIGKHESKTLIVVSGAFLICLGAAYKCGTSYLTPVPRSQPLPAYFDRACFYIFNFVVEVLVVYGYAIARWDLRFHIPNGAKGPGSYSKTLEQNGSNEKLGDAEQ